MHLFCTVSINCIKEPSFYMGGILKWNLKFSPQLSHGSSVIGGHIDMDFWLLSLAISSDLLAVLVFTSFSVDLNFNPTPNRIETWNWGNSTDNKLTIKGRLCCDHKLHFHMLFFRFSLIARVSTLSTEIVVVATFRKNHLSSSGLSIRLSFIVTNWLRWLYCMPYIVRLYCCWFVIFELYFAGILVFWEILALMRVRWWVVFYVVRYKVMMFW